MLNPATLLPLLGGGEQHDCAAAVQQLCTPRPGLTETPLTNPDLVLFVYGSAFLDPAMGKKIAWVMLFVLQIKYWFLVLSLLTIQHKMESLLLFLKLCKLAEGKSVIIYTDCCFDFRVVHDFGALWQQRDFLTSGAPINNHDLGSALWDAILLPLPFDVFKCAAHMNNPDPASQGNAKVDAAALSVVLSEVSHQVKDALPPQHNIQPGD